MQISEQLPKGNIADPSTELKKEWFYSTFPRTHRMAYCAQSKKLEEDDFEGITEFMRLQLALERSKGMVKFEKG